MKRRKPRRKRTQSAYANAGARTTTSLAVLRQHVSACVFAHRQDATRARTCTVGCLNLLQRPRPTCSTPATRRLRLRPTRNTQVKQRKSEATWECALTATARKRARPDVCECRCTSMSAHRRLFAIASRRRCTQETTMLKTHIHH